MNSGKNLLAVPAIVVMLLIMEHALNLKKALTVDAYIASMPKSVMLIKSKEI